MAAGKQKKSLDLLTLFVRGIDQKQMPARDKDRYLNTKKVRAAVEESVAAYQHRLEELEGPALLAALKSAGSSVEQEKKALNESRAAYQKLKQQLGEATYKTQLGFLGSDAFMLGAGKAGRECVDINVHVCQEWLCVDQRLPIPINDISTESGFDGSFNRVAVDGFRVSDDVSGWSTWNLTYHRHSRTHDGKISILAGAALVASTAVKGLGMRFVYLPGGSNGAGAHGKDPIGKPPSWGHVKAWYEITIRYQRPGEGWVTWYNGAETKYLDWGPIESNVAGHPNFFETSIYSDPSEWARDLFVDREGTFPPDTQFTIEVEMSYWIKGNGDEGEASIDYSMRVQPYILMEACSYEYPETLTINLADYV